MAFRTYNHPEVLLIAVPVVLLLCWLYNAHKLRQYKRGEATPPVPGQKVPFWRLVLLALLIVAVMVTAAVLYAVYVS